MGGLKVQDRDAPPAFWWVDSRNIPSALNKKVMSLGGLVLFPLRVGASTEFADEQLQLLVIRPLWTQSPVLLQRSRCAAC